MTDPPHESARFTAAEEQSMRMALTAGTLPACPRCAVSMTRRAIGGGSFGLGYHRQREWLLCPSCRRSAIFDVRRGTRL
jgi:transposase-like protein